ncbi:MAG: hypothetical protein ACK4V4_04815 [Sphingobacteriales bacterium]|jgi:hypothetical protein
MNWISRYSKWITLFAFILLVAACYMPWAFYPDLQKSFTGFFTEKNIYGKPAKLLISFGVFSVVAQFLNFLFLKRTNMLFTALSMAYAVKTYLVYGACYHAICPEKQLGLFLMLFSVVLLMFTAVFPSGTVKTTKPLTQP